MKHFEIILQYVRTRLGLDPTDAETKALLAEDFPESTSSDTPAADIIIDRLLSASGRSADNILIEQRTLAAIRKLDRERNKRRAYHFFRFEAGTERLVSVIAACVILCFGFWWAANLMLPSPIAILDPYGSVWILRQKQRLTPTVPTKLYSGDTVITGERSRAIIRYRRHRTYISLRADSRMRLFASSTGQLALLDTGSMAAGVSAASGRSHFTVETPHARVFMESATQFKLRSTQSESVIEVIEGETTLQSLSSWAEPIEIEAGAVVAVNGGRRLVPGSFGAPVIANVRGLDRTEIENSLRLGRLFGVNTLAYDLPLSGTKPPEALVKAVAEAHKQGFMFYARVDLKTLVSVEKKDPGRWIRENLAPLVAEYDFDGVYFYNGGDLVREKEIASILMPLYDSLVDVLPGTAMLIGYSRDPNA